uniref:Uncharacterized protein n=1 Tax=Glossina brevipalpis TaxID=37001 RepID=A0A1A9X3Q8_9MUSC
MEILKRIPPALLLSFIGTLMVDLLVQSSSPPFLYRIDTSSSHPFLYRIIIVTLDFLIWIEEGIVFIVTSRRHNDFCTASFMAFGSKFLHYKVFIDTLALLYN